MNNLEKQLNDLIARIPERPNRESQAAFEQFKAIGFPTTKWENWRFTNISEIKDQSWRLSLPSDLPANVSTNLDSESISPYTIYFINGHYQPNISTLPPTVNVLTLKDYYEKYSSSKFYQTSGDNEPFYMMNTAFNDSGIAVIIPKDIKPDHPILIHYLKTDLNDPIMFHPRTIIHGEKGSESTIIEYHSCTDNSVYYSNNLTEISLDENAKLTFISLQNESKSAYDIHTIRSTQKSHSNLTAGVFNSGSLLSRKNIYGEINGEGADLGLFGLTITADKQVMDIQSVVNHCQPECTSDQLFKYILNDESKGVFKGKVIVSQDAQKTDAKQSNKNLILSKDARINSDPQLEIYADDVKCSHGSTTGSLDKEAVFYLQSRGLDESAAKMLLIDGFAGEVIQKISDENIQHLVSNLFNTSQQ